MSVMHCSELYIKHKGLIGLIFILVRGAICSMLRPTHQSWTVLPSERNCTAEVPQSTANCASTLPPAPPSKHSDRNGLSKKVAEILNHASNLGH